ncbi:MAG TPA: hypothetical protein VGQ57_04490 [Polyangiaceae bacterium]|nr:hypothetical protein [Polyangiaceae bacterium]
MHLKQSSILAALAATAFVTAPRPSFAKHPAGAQLCTLGADDVGKQGTLVCKNVLTGALTQSIPVGTVAAAAGTIGGSLMSKGDRVLVTNQVGGALLFRALDGTLRSPVALQTGGESSLSGALNGHGAYVLTGTMLRFFPSGQTTAGSSQRLLLGDGSAAEVTLTDRYAYVSEKNGSLEAFPIGRDGNLAGPAATVTGLSAGVIVGITGSDDTVVAPIAHLASNFGQAEIDVAAGLAGTQHVPIKEVAACWAANEDGEACVSNPGSMTISCGQLGADGFESYTSAAANPVGESMFDLDMRDGLVGLQAIHGGAPVLLTYSRGDGDFLSFVSEYPVGAAKASGALLLPPMSR